jgi:excisionase family DNA binding protein
MAGEDDPLTRAEAAERLHLSVQTIRPLADAGHLTEVRVGLRAVRVRAASVDRLICQGLPRRRWVREYQHQPVPSGNAASIAVHRLA